MIVAAVQQSELLALVRCGAKVTNTEYAHLVPGWLSDREFAAKMASAAEAGKACGHRSAQEARQSAKESIERYFGL